jgi:hypothetical protein
MSPPSPTRLSSTPPALLSAGRRRYIRYIIYIYIHIYIYTYIHIYIRFICALLHAPGAALRRSTAPPSVAAGVARIGSHASDLARPSVAVCYSLLQPVAATCCLLQPVESAAFCHTHARTHADARGRAAHACAQARMRTRARTHTHAHAHTRAAACVCRRAVTNSMWRTPTSTATVPTAWRIAHI